MKKHPVSFFTRGFTLIEITIVITVISILASIIFFSTEGARARARFTQVETALDQMKKAAELYYLDYGHFPDDVAQGNPPTFVNEYYPGWNPPTVCPGYIYDFQNWPDRTDWGANASYRNGSKVVKITYYDDTTPDRIAVAEKCVHTEPGWQCPAHITGGQGVLCCNSNTENCAVTRAAQNPPPVPCVDISSQSNRTLYCN